ncbi:MAG: HU family DNA-binding protein [Muribaculaceae bacterium]|nr:HU family DNA-binding protein [Muribaculaceae bacterium]
MDNKITLSVLAQMLSDRTGRGRKECEDMLRSFFQTISGALAAGEPVKVRGFGTFKISQVDARMSVDISSGEDYEIPAHNRIVFLPAKELAGAVNAPFEMFETIELADGISENELQGEEMPAEAPVPPIPGETEPEAEPAEEALSEDSGETDREAEPAEEAVTDISATPASHSAPVAEPEEEMPVQQSPVNTALNEEKDAAKGGDAAKEEETIKEDPVRVRSRFGHGFVWGMSVAVLVIVLGIGALYFINEDFSHNFDRLMGTQRVVDKNVQAEPAASPATGMEAGIVAEAADIADEEAGMADIVEDAPSVSQDEAVDAGTSDAGEKAVPTQPSDKPVYDTITRTTGLGVLARKHYGNFHFWPYIYMENEKILGHPDRIRPNTRVVVPPLSKYGVDPKNPADVAKAKRLDAEIYARYKKKH